MTTRIQAGWSWNDYSKWTQVREVWYGGDDETMKGTSIRGRGLRTEDCGTWRSEE